MQSVGKIDRPPFSIHWKIKEQTVQATVFNLKNKIGKITFPILKNHSSASTETNVSLFLNDYTSINEDRRTSAFIPLDAVKKIFMLKKCEIKKGLTYKELESLIVRYCSLDGITNLFNDYQYPLIYQFAMKNMIHIELAERIKTIKIFKALFPSWLCANYSQHLTVIIGLSPSKKDFIEMLLPYCKNEVPKVKERLVNFLSKFPEDDWEIFSKERLLLLSDLFEDKKSMILFLFGEGVNDSGILIRVLNETDPQNIEKILTLINLLTSRVGIEELAPIFILLSTIPLDQHEDLIFNTQQLLSLFPFNQNIVLLIKALRYIDPKSRMDVINKAALLKSKMFTIQILVQTLSVIHHLDKTERPILVEFCAVLLTNAGKREAENINIFFSFIKNLKTKERESIVKKISRFFSQSRGSLIKMISFLSRSQSYLECFIRAESFVFPEFSERIFGDDYFNEVKKMNPQKWDIFAKEAKRFLLKARKDLSLDCVVSHLALLEENELAIFVNAVIPFAKIINETSLDNLVKKFKGDHLYKTPTIEDIMNSYDTFHHYSDGFSHNINILSPLYNSIKRLIDVSNLTDDDLPVIKRIGRLPQAERDPFIDKVILMKNIFSQREIPVKTSQIAASLNLLEDSHLLDAAFMVKAIAPFHSFEECRYLLKVLSCLDVKRREHSISEILKKHKHLSFHQLINEIKKSVLVEFTPSPLHQKQKDMTKKEWVGCRSVSLNLMKFQNRNSHFPISTELQAFGHHFLMDILKQLKGILKPNQSPHTHWVKKWGSIFSIPSWHSQTSYYLLKSFKYISTLSDELLAGGLSEKQEAFLKLSDVLQDCNQGFIESICDYYSFLPTSAKLDDETTELSIQTIHEAIEINFQTILNYVFRSESYLNKLGINSNSISEILLIKSSLYCHVGLNFEITPITYSETTKKKQLKIPTTDLLQTFFEEITPSKLIKQISSDHFFSSKSILPLLLQIVPAEEDFYEFDDRNTIQKLTTEGIIHLLQKTEWLNT